MSLMLNTVREILKYQKSDVSEGDDPCNGVGNVTCFVSCLAVTENTPGSYLPALHGRLEYPGRLLVLLNS